MTLAGGPGVIPDVLDPASEAGQRIADLAWFLLIAGTVVFIAVMVMLALAIRAGRAAPAGAIGERGGRRLQIVAGGIIPAAIVVVLFVVTVRAITAYTATAASDVTDVEVIGHMWWWEVRYPRLGIVSANEVHLPAGRPVRLTVRTADVIHSFWVPRLHGKIDLVPGRTNTIRLDATRAGTYRGQCAEYCGLQHTRMAITVVAHELESYTTWAGREQAPAAVPTDTLASAGARVFEVACASCHTVRGTLATGTEGPDLTHLASRASIGAGTLPNTTANLAAWVADAQRFKPGNGMPPMSLREADLRAVVAYLETLR
ncbi:MAG: cytochrome c oxidase subunit II [Gemmatimonadaceae bacterium]